MDLEAFACPSKADGSNSHRILQSAGPMPRGSVYGGGCADLARAPNDANLGKGWSEVETAPNLFIAAILAGPVITSLAHLLKSARLTCHVSRWSRGETCPGNEILCAHMVCTYLCLDFRPPAARCNYYL